MPESVKQRGKEKHCFGFGRSTTADCLHARCRRLSVFIFSDKSKNTHAFIRVSEKARGGGVKLMMSGSQQAEAHPHDHPILWRLGQLIREFIVWLFCSPQDLLRQRDDARMSLSVFNTKLS